MNTLSVFLIALFLTIINCSPVEVPKISSGNNGVVSVATQDSALKFDGVSDAIFSSSGEYLAVQGPSKFYIVPTANLFNSYRSLEQYPTRSGKMMGFISSSKLVYSESDEIFTFDAADGRVEKLFNKDASKPLANKDRGRREFVIVSADLIVTGDGNWDWGEKKGNIYLFNLKNRKVTKGATIPAFWYAAASSDGRYVLYEHGAEANNNVDIYDILTNKNSAISDHFNFKKLLPEMKGTDEVPIAWLNNNHQFLAVIQPNDEVENTDIVYLVLFDLAGKRILWKTKLEESFFPSSFQESKDGRALLCLNSGIHELSLTNGKLTKLEGFNGTQCSSSPDRNEVAFVDSNNLIVAATAGDHKQKLLELETAWKFDDDYKGMGRRPPMWSPKADSLILFGKNQILLVKVR